MVNSSESPRDNGDATRRAEMDADTDRARSWTGLGAVLGSDAAIVVAAVWGMSWATDGNQVVALLTSAFTAITAITTAYFGVKAAANTAQRAIRDGGYGRYERPSRED